MKEFKSVVWLTIAAFIFRLFLYLFFANDLVIGSDQIQMSIHGRLFASGDYYGVFSTYWAPLYPLLLGFMTLFTHSIVQSAIIITIVTGSLIVPLTYYLVKQSYGEQEAVIAGIIAIFFPHFVNSMFALGTENPYFLLIIGALVMGWKALKRDSVTDFLVTGILLGLAYLTRPEAFGYIAFFAAFILFNGWKKKKLISLISAKQLATFLVGFTLLAAPYILYLRYETNIWTISGKVQMNTIIGDLEAEGEANNLQADEAEDTTAKTFIKYFAKNLIEFNKFFFPFLLPPFLLIFVGLGLFMEFWDKERLEREAYLILFCLLTIAGYAAAVMQTRYFYILLPIFFGWIACGILHFGRWMQRTFQNLLPDNFAGLISKNAVVALCLSLIFLYVLPINFFMRTKDKAWQYTQYEEREAGLWLKENGKPSSLVFSATLRPVFYSESKHLPPTKTNIDEILREIKEKKVDYVITSDRSIKRNPYLKGFTEILQNDPMFELIYEKTPYPNYSICIYKVNGN